MKLKLAFALFAAAFFLSIPGADAATLSGNSTVSAIQPGIVRIGCVGGRRCAGYYTRNGVRVCRSWVACR